MPTSGSKGFLRWLLLGWRQATFSVLAVYTVAAVIFLGLGGASPESSMDVMEEEIVAAASASSGVSEIVSQAGSCDEIDPTALLASATNSDEAVHAITFNTLNLEPASLSGYAGCPLIINFFASWCVPCVTEMPDIEQFWNTHGSQVAVVGLAVEDVEPARAIVAETGVTYSIGLDESDLLIELGGLGMPTTVFVSAEGELLQSHSGILTFDDLVSRANEHFDLDDYFEANDGAEQ